MILPLIVHYAEQGEREVDPYASWVGAIQRLRDDWQNGVEPDVLQLREYLQDIAAEIASEALLDLIAEHMHLTWRAGQGTRLEQYLAAFGQEFGELASSAVVPADLVEDEFLARYSLPYGDMPPLEEYRTRFPARADVIESLRNRGLAGGRYVKLKKRGQGAMGDVWEAYDRHLGRRVAIKEPKPALRDQPEIMRRFIEEARITARLEHTNIVTVHEYAEETGHTPFYVMRLIEGPTLHEQIREFHQPEPNQTTAERCLHWHRLLQSFVSVCDVIAYAHARQVLHRDLKPGNIVIGQFGETVTLDWGMARQMPSAVLPTITRDQGTAQQAAGAGGAAATIAIEQGLRTVEGTPQYMAPEQVDGISDVRSDIFGLGAILYEMMANRPVYDWPDGCQPADWQRIVREAQFPQPRRLNPRASPVLEAICLMALKRNPTERYQTAGELAQDMRRYLAGQPVAARPESLLGRSWRKLRRPNW